MNLRFLRPLYDTPGPWASVYLDDSLDTENGRAEVGLRWRALREALRRQGANEPTVEAVEDAVRGAEPGSGPHGLAVFAHDPELIHTEVMSAPPPVDSAEYGPLPHVAPLLVQRGQRISWLRVVVDRTGGTIESASSSSIDVSGSETYPIRKIAPGGYANARFQREAEENWQRNAQDVAEELTRLADTMGPEVIIVAGDVQARRLLVEQLPVRWQNKIVLTDAGSRAPGADPEALDDVTTQVIAQTAQEHADSVLDRLRAEHGEDAAIGIAPVLTAFNRGQVETLLLDAIGLAGTKLWLDPASGQLAEDPGTLPGGGTSAQQVLAEDALIRAAATTDADLLMVTATGTDGSPLELRDGVGAVLRYSDAATPHE
ncbi:MAG: peptide chain release factor 1 [Hamadaea sp.]|uniref:baeRF2 domain-containing protein n=1 Tax=Hamadaea sp. TaxID=2024425 RepID=UPI0017A04199|nr:Vms1/Ankzf1 family peptidyl-tRNA hydrolase [Hamadaea sp.]NUR74516.1 peptide chain release factor 1 [Hamadaea sp.]NUT20986.1 peptide chain release factor 1 [Hamadaea sp.]